MTEAAPMKTANVCLAVCGLVAAAVFGIAPAVMADGMDCTDCADPVDIDIKPCKDPNVLNVNVTGWLPVCLPSDVLEGTEVSEVDLEGVLAVTVFWSDQVWCMLAKFDAASVIDTLGSVQNGEQVELVMTYTITDAAGVETDYCGCDTVTILKRGNRQ